MGTRLNRYYNNPAIGQAFDNLASIFAPPDATEVLAYAQAAKARRETQGLTDLYGLAADPNADLAALDRLGAATGQWNPSSGFGARDMESADRRYGVDVGASTARRGQDITSGDNRYRTDVDARTTLATNGNTVRGSLIGDLFGPVSEGQIRPSVPDDIMAAVGLPGVDQVTGLPKAKSADQIEGDLLLEAVTGGLYGPADAAANARSDVNIEEIVDATGTPQIVTRADAIGQRPYVQPGSAPAQVFKTYLTPDGRKGTARLDPGGSGMPVDAMTGAVLPEGTITGDITDTQAGMTTSTNSGVQGTGLASVDAIKALDRLSALVAANPGSQGLAGVIRGTVQDALATGDDLSRQFGGEIAEIQNAVKADPTLQAAFGQNVFDPSIPAIDMQANALAWQIAKIMAGGDRVSNQQLEEAKAQVGASGILTNTQGTAARLAQLRQQILDMAATREGIQASPIARQLDALRTPPATPAPAPAAAAARPRAVNPQTGAAVEWDGTAWVPAQ